MTEERTLRPAASPPGMVAIPAGESMPTAATKALLSLVQHLPAGSILHWETRPFGLAAKRNLMVGEFLKHDGLEWLLMLDSDMIVPPQVVQRLITSGTDIIGGLYFSRHYPFPSEAGFRAESGSPHLRYLQEFGGPNPLRPVDWVGAGALLVRRRVFYEVSPPWFGNEPVNSGGPDVTAEGRDVTVSIVNERNEDVGFCARALAAGFQPYVDTALVSGHVGAVTVDLDFALRYHGATATREMIQTE
jgi:hypothetical protein